MASSLTMYAFPKICEKNSTMQTNSGSVWYGLGLRILSRMSVPSTSFPSWPLTQYRASDMAETFFVMMDVRIAQRSNARACPMGVSVLI